MRCPEPIHCEVRVPGTPYESAATRWKEVLGKDASKTAFAPERLMKPCFTPAGASTVSPGPRLTTSSPSTASSCPLL